jgi:6-phosphogluconolactonase (cycloisomerase 2 family)
MKSKRVKAILATAFLLALAAGALVGCSSGQLDAILGGGRISFVTTPKFLVATDYDATGTSVNVFPVNASDGTLGTLASYDMGMTAGMTIVVHPNGHWVYEADGNDGSIHQWDVNTTTGVPTDIAAKVFNESGTYFQPNTPETTQVLALTPDGKYLIASNDDAMVTVFSIGSNGALTHVGDYSTGGNRSGSIATNGTYVWVNDEDDSCDDCTDATYYHVVTMKIGSGGALSVSGSPAQISPPSHTVYWLWSMAVSPDGKFLQVGDEDGYVFSFTIGANGALTMASPAEGVYLTGANDVRDLAYRPDGKFFYGSEDGGEIHAAAQHTDGTMSETTNSPWTAGPGQIAVDFRGKFLYVASGYEDAGVYLYTIDPTSGELTFVNNYTTFTNQPNGVGIVRVAP